MKNKIDVIHVPNYRGLHTLPQQTHVIRNAIMAEGGMEGLVNDAAYMKISNANGNVEWPIQTRR